MASTANPNTTLKAVGTVVNAALGKVPVAGSALQLLFGQIWNSLNEDAKIGTAGMVSSVKAYVDEKLQYAKEQAVLQAIRHLNSRCDDLEVQIGLLRRSAIPQQTVIDTLYDCIKTARDALDIMYDPEWAHITFQSYAEVASRYLSLLEDGIKDPNNWGINAQLKATFQERNKKFFDVNEFSELLGRGMDKMPKSLSLKELAMNTAALTQYWYCLNTSLYPAGSPEIITGLSNSSAAAPTNKARHVHFQPPDGDRSPMVVNNIPCGRIMFTETAPQTTVWNNYYPARSTSPVLQFVNPSGTYPVTVAVRYYRIITTWNFGMNMEFRLSFSPGSTLTYAIPSGQTQPNPRKEELTRTEAVLIWTNPLSYNTYARGVAADARVAYEELGTFSLSAPAAVTIQWRKTEFNPEPAYVSALELLIK